MHLVAASRYRRFSSQSGRPATTVVIPALNEAASIAGVLDAIPRGVVSEVIVVDGGSVDGTPGEAATHGARVLFQWRGGYGEACAAGARDARGEIVVFIDGDGAADPRQIPALVAPIADGEAEMVLGSRLVGRVAPGAMPWHQRSGNRLCAAIIRGLYHQPLTDLGPFRAVRREALEELPLENFTYGWPTEMIVKGARRGWRIVEVPVSWNVRTGGRSKISGTVRGTVKATFEILRTILAHAYAS